MLLNYKILYLLEVLKSLEVLCSLKVLVVSLVFKSSRN